MNLTNLQLNQQKKALIVVFIILIAFIDIGYILKAQRAGLKRMNLKISKLKADLVNLNQGLENMRAFGGGKAKVARSFSLLSGGQISGLLQEISSAANKFNIQVDQISPTRQVQKGKPAAGQDKLTSMLINLDLVSDYHNLGRFIQELENFQVFMGVEGLEITIQLPNYMKQEIKLSLKTYVVK